MKHVRCFRGLNVFFIIVLAVAATAQAATAPVAQCGDVTVGAGPGCLANASIDNGSYDPDGDPVTITQSPPGPYPLGSTPVTLTITDNGGLWDQCVATVTVTDVTPPSITCPGPFQIDCLTDMPGPQMSLVHATDDCDAGPTLIHVGDFYEWTACPITVVRTYMAEDDYGNIAFCEQFVTVDDQEPPVLIGCPPDLTLGCDEPVPEPALVTAVDNCVPELVVDFLEIETPGGSPQERTITRIWSAVDQCDNYIECTQQIVIGDHEGPVLHGCPVDVEICRSDQVPAPADVYATDNCDPAPVVTFEESETGGACPERIITRTWTAHDATGHSASCSHTITVRDETPPVCVAPADQNLFQCRPEEICLPVSAVDNCATAPVLTLVDGPGELTGGQWCYTPDGPVSIDVTIRAEDGCGNFDEATFHVAVTVNRPPQLIVCPQPLETLAWGQSFAFDFVAEDPDEAQALTFGLGDNVPGGVTIDPATGHLVRTTCVPEITVVVVDPCGAADTCEFEICTENAPPVIDCPEDRTLCYGSPFEDLVTAYDPDVGATALFHLIDGPPGVTVDEESGIITWLEPEPGVWDICVAATDRYVTCDPCEPAAADTCCFTLSIRSLGIVVEKVHGQIQGQYADVGVGFLHQGSNWPVAGFDFLIEYDAAALSFVMASEGEFFRECEWEYFTYRFGANGDCGDLACPSGVLRIIGLAESTTGSGADSPDCFSNDGLAVPGPQSSTATEIAVLNFLVSNDRTLECQFVPIKFAWYGCGDNVLSNRFGDTLFTSHRVYDFAGQTGDPPVTLWNEITALDIEFPTVTGAPAAECNVSWKNETVACADFYHGGIDIICSDDIDAPGDVNLNGIAYEIADAVMLSNYFVVGLAAFGDCTGLSNEALEQCQYRQEGAIAASDVNRDGIPLSIADLVYLIRVVVGDAQPYAKSGALEPVRVGYSLEDGILAVGDDLDIGGAAVLCRGDVRPELLVQGMKLQYAFDGANTRILVAPEMTGTAPGSFRGAFLAGLTGDLLSLELATAEGSPVAAGNMPLDFRLGQNYPNPFNPVTEIAFDLPVASEVTLEVLNLLGQRVAVLVDGYREAGSHTAVWEAGNMASGIYLYRLTADGRSVSRKMILIK